LSLSSDFLSPVQLRRGSDRAVLLGIWHLSRPNQNSGSQQTDPLMSKAMNDGIRLAHGLFWSWLNAEKVVAGSDPF